MIAEDPLARSLPTGQPDGGRDAFVRNDDGACSVVYQVKFSKNPSSKEARESIIDLVRSEKDKVAGLIEDGLVTYYFLTNVSGTAHKDVGSVDRLDEILTDLLGVKSKCWWREDIEARVDNSSVRWSYPEILSGADVLGVLLNSDLGENTRRRSNAISAYIGYHYEQEKDVKFKQIDLENNIFNLFTDLYIAVPPNSDAPEAEVEAIKVSRLMYAAASAEYEANGYSPALANGVEFKISASTFLSLSSMSSRFRAVVLEGGPGQGKSTITQFMCQLFRARLLGKFADLDGLHSQYKSGSVKLPLKIDLRDYANWIRDRIDNIGAEALVSLETYLSYSIERRSGGFAYSVSDLIETLRSSSAMIVLDGFDEVADVDLRERIIAEATAAANRFNGMQLDFQIVVTSRPTAFVNAPAFDGSIWRHVELSSLDRRQASDYLGRWTRAKKLPVAEIDLFSQRAMTRLAEEHIAELAKNPMQLAILLSLMWSMGESLPDKRTALYTSYVELFLNREAEKDSVVRDHREIVIELHGHIAWLLQCKVEREGGDGRMSEADLLSEVQKYLKQEQYEDVLAGKLFTAMRQRVVAIVSRVEGTYEFEVQPLREYFVGSYLYQTSPYSPTGREKGGTRPDRFAALSRNPYWTNVTRFYAGNYSKGELPGLREGLEELLAIPVYGKTSGPSSLALTLLSDWVFSQSIPSRQAILKALCEVERFRIFASTTYGRGRALITLPERQGRAEIVRAALDGLLNARSWDDRHAFATVLKSNLGITDRMALWPQLSSLDPADRAAAAYSLDLLQYRGLAYADIRSAVLDGHIEIGDVFGDESYSADLIADDDVFSIALERSLNAVSGVYYFDEAKGAREALLCVFTALLSDEFIAAVSHSTDDPVAAFIPIPFRRNDKIDFKSSDLAEVVSDWVLNGFSSMWLSSKTWQTSVQPWSKIVNDGIGIWGGRSIFYRMALIACIVLDDAISSGADVFDDSDVIGDVYRAYSMSIPPERWEELFRTKPASEQLPYIAAFILKSNVALLDRLSPALEELIGNYTAAQFSTLLELVKDAARLKPVEDRAIKFTGRSARFAALLAITGNDAAVAAAFDGVLLAYAGSDGPVLSVRSAMSMDVSFSCEPAERLAMISAAYANKCAVYPNALSQPSARDGSLIDYQMAEAVLANPCAYPAYIISAANVRAMEEFKTVGVAERSSKEEWFAGG